MAQIIEAMMNKKDADKLAQAYNDLLTEIPRQVLEWIKSTSETLKSAESGSGESAMTVIDISENQAEEVDYLKAAHRYPWLKRIPVEIEDRHVYATITDGQGFIVYSMTTSDKKRVDTFIEYLKPRDLAIEILQSHPRITKIVHAFEYELYEKQRRIASHISGALSKIFARKLTGDLPPQIEVVVYKIATMDSVYFNIELCADPMFKALIDGEYS